MRVRSCLLLGLLSAGAVRSGPVITSDLTRRTLVHAQPLTLPLGKRHGDDEEDDSYVFGSHPHSPANDTDAARPDSHAVSEMASPAEHDHARPSGHDDHHSHNAPMTLINETFILLTHAPDPPAYYELEGGAAHSSLLWAHILSSSVAFFGFLPLAMALRMGQSSLAVVAQVGFVAVGGVGLLLGLVYSAATPELYAGNKHKSFGLLAGLLVVALAAVDFARFVKPKSWLGTVQSTKEERAVLYHQVAETEAVVDEAEEGHFVVGSPTELDDATDRHNWAAVNSHSDARPSTSHPRNSSISCSSDDTVVDHHDHLTSSQHGPALLTRLSPAARLLRPLPAILEWTLLFIGYSQVITGIAVYYGACRGNYKNGCVAHAAKGSIFLWFGLLTWARFLGAFAGKGWAWNRRPEGASKGGWSMEFVESLVIFIYGSTNVWLERLGKNGAPWSVKDVQHASIAGEGSLAVRFSWETIRC